MKKVFFISAPVREENGTQVHPAKERDGGIGGGKRVCVVGKGNRGKSLSVRGHLDQLDARGSSKNQENEKEILHSMKGAVIPRKGGGGGRENKMMLTKSSLNWILPNWNDAEKKKCPTPRKT